MNKLTFSLILFLTCLGIRAETLVPTGVFISAHQCFKSVDLIKNLNEEYGETAVLLGKATVLTPEAEFVEGVMILFVNQQDRTWTQTVRYADGIACVIATGSDITLREETQKSKTKH